MPKHGRKRGADGLGNNQLLREYYAQQELRPRLRLTAPMKQLLSTQTLLNIGWLALLAIYVAAGTMLAPFHGDEAMHIYTSTDYATAFLDGHIDQLTVQPPYDIDSDPRLRLLNGSVMRYSVGLAWHLAGFSLGVERLLRRLRRCRRSRARCRARGECGSWHTRCSTGRALRGPR